MNSYSIMLNGKTYEVDVIKKKKGGVEVTRMVQSAQLVSAPAAQAEPVAAPKSESADGGSEVLKAPLPGTVLQVCVKPGETVKRGQMLFMLEAMKMENEIFAGVDGTVREVNVAEGQAIQTGTVLCTIG